MPIPILVLLAVVALFVYAIIGSVVGAITVEKMKPEDAFGTFLAASLLWPAWLAINTLFWSCVLVLAGPVWVAGKVGSYISPRVCSELED